MLKEISQVFSGVRELTNSFNAFINSSFPINFANPELLLLIVPLIIALFILFKKHYINDVSKKIKWFVFVSRTILIILLCAILAQPYMELTKTIPGDQEITILIDDSKSMELYDTSFVNQLVDSLDNSIPVKTKIISTDLDSPLGDEIISALGKNKNLLLITDGDATRGVTLTSAGVLASSLNASISMISLDEINSDASVNIIGPSKTIANNEVQYKININKVGVTSVPLTVTIDNVVVFNQETSKNSIIIKTNYSEGDHKVFAKITSPDHFSENNVFYKTTKVIPKPKILIITKNSYSTLQEYFSQLYTVDVKRTLPNTYEELNNYYGIIFDDIPTGELLKIEHLSKYTIEGNGLLFTGGFNSFDNGNYQGTIIESLLPVQVGRGEKIRGDANIVIVIDISMSTGIVDVDGKKSVDIQKALALSVIDGLNEGHRVGAVAFNTNAYKVEDLLPLYANRGTLKDKISRLDDSGATVLQAGMRGAFELLNGKAGSNNVIFITDGVTLDSVDLRETKNIVKSMYDLGIKTYIVGVGRNAKNINSDYLAELGSLGGGFYMEASDANRLKIVFGEPEDKDSGSAFEIVPIDTNHYITEGLNLDAVLQGFNQVLPKKSARLLATTDAGDPALTVWNYGIGRVGALTVFSGNNNLGPLLSGDNTLLLSRIGSWVVGDPERKEEYFINIDDARINKTSYVTVRTNKIPSSQQITFNKVGNNTYNSRFIPTTIGFDSILDVPYAINYDKEYQNIGINNDLTYVVENSKGKIFKPSNTNEIIQHVKYVSERTISDKQLIIYEIFFLMLLIFITEIFIRRIMLMWLR